MTNRWRTFISANNALGTSASTVGGQAAATPATWTTGPDGKPIETITVTAGAGAHVVLINPADEDLYDWAVNYRPSGYNTVIVHGNAQGLFSNMQDASGAHYSSKFIAGTLRAAPGYNPDLPSELISCDSACGPGASNVDYYLQQLNIQGYTPGSYGPPDMQPLFAPAMPVHPADSGGLAQGDYGNIPAVPYSGLNPVDPSRSPPPPGY